ncbi:hypothetical protein CDAR_570751 [Caerostris darwini]|uniref:Uncharacterized protein n=1 Tax=Caerostris darwini TaxID=1538125 RepID=A0AAV4QG72_9ARAC|nr:hypothetical protein CDAR_570751 [Caerostris darwini]
MFPENFQNQVLITSYAQLTMLRSPIHSAQIHFIQNNLTLPFHSVCFHPRNHATYDFVFSNSFTHENRRMFSNRVLVSVSLFFLGKSCPEVKELFSSEGQKGIGQGAKKCRSRNP